MDQVIYLRIDHRAAIFGLWDDQGIETIELPSSGVSISTDGKRWTQLSKESYRIMLRNPTLRSMTAS